MSAPAVCVADSDLLAVAAMLDADTLAHLAATARQLRRPRFIDPERAADEILSILARRSLPTIGWWQRNTLRDDQ